jgi:hypothetical protein
MSQADRVRHIESRKLMRYQYFVSYTYTSRDGAGFGFGSTVISTAQPITAESLNQVKAVVAEEVPGSDVVMLCFQLLANPAAAATV